MKRNDRELIKMNHYFIFFLNFFFFEERFDLILKKGIISEIIDFHFITFYLIA